MEITANNIYKPLFVGNSRYYILMGGRANGRSFTASQYALSSLISREYFRCAIMRFVLGDIRNSIFQEIKDRIEDEKLEQSINIKENLLTFEFDKNKINGIGFRKSSGDQKSKLKSLANYTDIIIEEADEVSEEDFMQLDDSIRTKKSDIKIILLLNPPHKSHWIIKRWFNLVDSGIEGFYKAELKKTATDTTYIFGTYKKNKKNLNQKTIENYERYKETNPDHYYNIVRGLVSEGARGKIFNWRTITNKEYEELPYPVFYGLDFGFSNDPASLTEIKKHNDNIWIREIIYETGLTNAMLSERMNQIGVSNNAYIYADSAEPKSIEELKTYGWMIKPAEKGADSIRAGIDLLKSKTIYYTEESQNIAEEVQNYKWALDRDKNPTNKPIDDYNHAIDGIRYAVTSENKSKPSIALI